LAKARTAIFLLFFLRFFSSIFIYLLMSEVGGAVSERPGGAREAREGTRSSRVRGPRSAGGRRSSMEVDAVDGAWNYEHRLARHTHPDSSSWNWPIENKPAGRGL
jgi:hypothetical protein